MTLRTNGHLLINLDTPLCPPWVPVPLPADCTCPLCHRTLTVRGFAAHVRACGPQHGLASARDYEQAHPMVLYSPAHEFAAKVFSLMKFSLSRFGLMNYAGLKWCHVDAAQRKSFYYAPWGRKPETRRLLHFQNGWAQLRKGAFYHFRQHLAGRLTLGIWPEVNNRFSLIDLDNEQVDALPEIVARLSDLHLHFYVEFSGKKGYHVWVFWDRDLPNAQLLRLNRYLTGGLPQDENIWPYKPGLVKLPLGLHRETGRLACFVDYSTNVIPLDEQFDYFLSIQDNPVPRLPAERAVTSRDVHHEKQVKVKKVARKDRVQKPFDGLTNEWLATNEECEEMLENGTIGHGLSRELLLLRLACHLRDEAGLTAQDCRNRLLAWSKRVSKRSVTELTYDMERQVQTCFLGDLHAPGRLPRLTGAQKTVIRLLIYDLLCTTRAASGSSRGLDRRQKEQAAQTVEALTEYLVRLILANKGCCHVSVRSLAQKIGVRVNVVQKWLPRIVAEPWVVAPSVWSPDHILGPSYVGRLFVRIGAGEYWGRRAQEYMLAEDFAAALGLPLVRRNQDVELWGVQPAQLLIREVPPHAGIPVAGADLLPPGG